MVQIPWGLFHGEFAPSRIIPWGILQSSSKNKDQGADKIVTYHTGSDFLNKIIGRNNTGIDPQGAFTKIPQTPGGVHENPANAPWGSKGTPGSVCGIFVNAPWGLQGTWGIDFHLGTFEPPGSVREYFANAPWGSNCRCCFRAENPTPRGRVHILP